MKKAIISVFLTIMFLIIPTLMAASQQTMLNQAEPQATSTGSYYAVIAACTRYQNTSHNVPKVIPYSDQALSRTYHGLLLAQNWQPDHITLLLNQNATKANIVSALHTMATTLGPDDFFLFQWCGHGTNVNDTDGDEARHTPGDIYDEAICPYDVEKYSEDNYTNVITDDELGRLFSNITCKGMVLIFDCCLSGSLVDATNQTNQTINAQDYWTTQGPHSLDVNGTNRIVMMATPPDCLERGTHYGYPLNNALGAACKIQTILHPNGTISAEKLFRWAKPIFNAETIVFWIGVWIYGYIIEDIMHPLINGPILLSILATINLLFVLIILQKILPQMYGYPGINQANICDDYPGELPLLQL